MSAQVHARVGTDQGDGFRESLNPAVSSAIGNSCTRQCGASRATGRPRFAITSSCPASAT